MLSVIVCVYNTDEKLFEDSLRSINSSAIPNLEIVVVDDGSTKDYSNIISKFPNIKYVKTENKGTMAARMLGVELTSNNHVCFVDSDDLITFDFLEASCKNIEDYDIIVNDWAFHTAKSIYVCKNDSTISSNIDSSSPLDLFFAQQGKEHSYYVLWNKVFRKQILLYACEQIKRLNLNKLVYAEDVLMSYFAFKQAKSIKNIHCGHYLYRIHSSQQVSVKSIEKLKNHTNSISKVFNIIEQDLVNSDKFAEYSNDLQCWKQLICSGFYAEAIQMNNKEFANSLLAFFSGCSLTKPKANSGKAYANHQLLPSNMFEINNKIKDAYTSNSKVSIFAKKNSYAYNKILKLQQYLNCKIELTSKKDSSIIMPKETIPLKQKILHNYFIFKLGMILFPKGSKIRKFLKEKF